MGNMDSSVGAQWYDVNHMKIYIILNKIYNTHTQY